MSLFKEELKKVVESGGLSKLYAQDDSAWNGLPVPSQEELNSFSCDLNFPFVTEAGYVVTKGPPKDYNRVVQKAAKLPKVLPFFKIYSDFTRFEIKVEDVTQLHRVACLLISDVLAQDPDAKLYVERNVFDPNAKDIVQRVNFYSPLKCGVITEVWIGHPFALKVFAENSYVREHPEEKDKYVSWFTEGRYDKIKEYILKGGENWEEEIVNMIVRERR